MKRSQVRKVNGVKHPVTTDDSSINGGSVTALRKEISMGEFWRLVAVKLEAITGQMYRAEYISQLMHGSMKNRMVMDDLKYAVSLAHEERRKNGQRIVPHLLRRLKICLN